MAKLYNLAGMSTATTGTGTITLGSAMYGHLTFAQAGVQDGETVTYAIKDGAASEIGRGVYTSSGTTLTRTALKSTNSNSAISLSGSAEVFITPAAEDIIPRLSSTTDNTVPRHDGTTGLQQTSGVVIDDSNNVTGVAALAVSGAVGIGTTSPGTTLQVRGGKIRFEEPGGDYGGEVFWGDNGVVLRANSMLNSTSYQPMELDFYSLALVNRTQTVATFKESGNVGIGTTSPSALLHNAGTTRLSALGAGTLVTDASGNVTASSDESLKDDIEPFSRGLAEIMGIDPISYNWNASSGLDRMNRYYGFSAQNVDAAIPEAVGVGADGFLTLQDRPILAALVNAVKELAGGARFEYGGHSFKSGRAEKDRAALLITVAQTAVIQGAQAGNYRWFDADADFTIDDASGVPVQMDAVSAFAYCGALLRAIL